MDTLPEAVPGRRRRRRHSDEFKARVVAQCRQPGVSIAGVALANGLNANLLRRWVSDLGQNGMTNRSNEDANARAQRGGPPCARNAGAC